MFQEKRQARFLVLAALALIVATLACGEEVSPIPVGQATVAEPSVTEPPAEEPTALWQVIVTSVQTDHVDLYVQNETDKFLDPPTMSATLEGIVNDQTYSYDQVVISTVRPATPVNPNYPDYERFYSYPGQIPPHFPGQKLRVTWTIPTTVRPFSLILTVAESPDPHRTDEPAAQAITVDLTTIQGSDDTFPTWPHSPDNAMMGDPWVVAGVWEITPIAVRRFNIFGPSSGVELNVKNIGGYTASFKSGEEGIKIFLFASDGGVYSWLPAGATGWDQRWGVLSIDGIPQILSLEPYSAFPAGDTCAQLEPATSCSVFIPFDTASTKINPVDGTNTFTQEVDPQAPLIDYEQAILLLLYPPTGEYRLYKVGE